MPSKYTPDRGDVVWLQSNPRSGHEQAGHRPALVLSPKNYNGRVGLALVCPITGQQKGYPFEVKVEVKDTSGVILSDQIKSLDWRARKAKRIGCVSAETLQEVRAKVQTLIQP